MDTRIEYHLKELVWFHGWTPSHWILMETADGLKARCTRVQIGHIEIMENTAPGQRELPVPPEMLSRIEKARPGSLPAIMGFDFLLCEGEPGAAVLNRPVNFPPANVNPLKELKAGRNEFLTRD